MALAFWKNPDSTCRCTKAIYAICDIVCFVYKLRKTFTRLLYRPLNDYTCLPRLITGTRFILCNAFVAAYSVRRTLKIPFVVIPFCLLSFYCVWRFEGFTHSFHRRRSQSLRYRTRPFRSFFRPTSINKYGNLTATARQRARYRDNTIATTGT